MSFSLHFSAIPKYKLAWIYNAGQPWKELDLVS